MFTLHTHDDDSTSLRIGPHDNPLVGIVCIQEHIAKTLEWKLAAIYLNGVKQIEWTPILSVMHGFNVFVDLARNGWKVGDYVACRAVDHVLMLNTETP
jgi:hypothetical protein